MTPAANRGDGRDAWTIRAATPDDAAAISEVLTAAGLAAWSSFLGSERIERATRGRTHPVDLVAADADGVFAFVGWDSETGEVTRLFTHPRGSGRGAGGALLDGAAEALRAADHAEAWLNTEERNERALRFYALKGWRPDGTARERDWHGARLREPRLVRNLRD